MKSRAAQLISQHAGGVKATVKAEANKKKKGEGKRYLYECSNRFATLARRAKVADSFQQGLCSGISKRPGEERRTTGSSKVERHLRSRGRPNPVAKCSPSVKIRRGRRDAKGVKLVGGNSEDPPEDEEKRCSIALLEDSVDDSGEIRADQKLTFLEDNIEGTDLGDETYDDTTVENQDECVFSPKNLHLNSKWEPEGCCGFSQSTVEDEAGAEVEGNDKKKQLVVLSGGVSLDPATLDVAALKQRIEENFNKLINFRYYQESQFNLKTGHGNSPPADDEHEGASRKQILSRLEADIVTFYQYNAELVKYFLQLLKPQEAYAFFAANEDPRPITLRTNTLKTRRRDLAASLIARGCNVDPLAEWTKVGLTVHDSVIPVGATPEYLAGHYMLQSAASLIPVMALAPQPGEKVVDMAAAPGGKTTYIAQLMKNTGTLYANDAKRDRCASLTGNLHRLGVTNCVVSCLDGRVLPSVLPPVDRALVDAPCSGSGIISRDPSIKVKRVPAEFVKHSELQKRLLCAAVDAVNADSPTGGFIVYSTCSVSVEENEEVIDYILKVRHVKLVPIGVEVGVHGLSGFRGRRFHQSVPLYTRRLYPHINNFDGFFVGKLKKLSNKKPVRIPKDRRRHNEFVKVWDKEHWNADYTEKLQEFGNEQGSPSTYNCVFDSKRTKMKTVPSRIEEKPESTQGT